MNKAAFSISHAVTFMGMPFERFLRASPAIFFAAPASAGQFACLPPSRHCHLVKLSGETMRLNLLLLAVAPVVLAGQMAFATDAVPSQGRLGDADFFRAVSCGAPTSGACQTSPRRFAKRNMTVAVLRTKTARPTSDQIRATSRAIDTALAQINATTTNITLTRVSGTAARQADIKLHFVSSKIGQRISGTQFPLLDGQRMQHAITVILPFTKGRIYKSGIALAANLPARDVDGVVLEELVQSLGLPWDIDNPYYVGKSVFSQHGNGVKRLSKQDRMAIKNHYK